MRASLKRKGSLAVSLSVFLILNVFSQTAFSQSKADSLTDEFRDKILNHFKYFTIGFYVDTYFNLTLDNVKDTSNLVPFASNCPVRDQIRINHGAVEFYYNAQKVRGKFVLQWGDAPNLLAAPDVEFIKNIRQANFGFRLFKDVWLDFGYMFNPVGYESSWAVINQISTVTIGGYYEIGSILGVKLSAKFSDKFSGGIIGGNFYSVAYGRNTNVAGMMFLTYQPLKQLSITYNNFFGNQALKDADIKNNLLYNNLIVSYSPVPQVNFVGQLDFAAQTNSTLEPDTNETATLFSGFLQAGYTFNERYSIYARYEFFNDPSGFLSGVYNFDNKTRGLQTNGFTGEFEYKPVKFGYIRVSYTYLRANPGNNVFYSGQLDYQNILTFTTGVRF